jgi:hypothetical protein
MVTGTFTSALPAVPSDPNYKYSYIKIGSPKHANVLTLTVPDDVNYPE